MWLILLATIAIDPVLLNEVKRDIRCDLGCKKAGYREGSFRRKDGRDVTCFCGDENLLEDLEAPPFTLKGRFDEN